jgi:hypothetical protein
MAALAYPLEQIIKVKEKRVEDQEKVVKLKQELLQQEKNKLLEREAVRDKAKDHVKAKLSQLREEMDHGTTTDKIQQMKSYLNVANDKLAVEEKKVLDQKAQVELAEKALQTEIDLLKVRRQEADKLKTHKTDWMKEARKEQEIIEGREQDELGSIGYTTNKRKNKSIKR